MPVSKEKMTRAAVAVLLLAALLAALFPAFATAQDEEIKFTLKDDPADPASVEVRLSFNMKAGQTAMLEPRGAPAWSTAGDAPPVIRMEHPGGEELSLAQVEGSERSWEVTAASDVRAEISYKVAPAEQAGTGGRTRTGAVEGPVTPRAISNSDLKAFLASDVLLAPQNRSGGYVSQRYRVKIEAGNGREALVPWKAPDSAGYRVGSTDGLLSNYLVWGSIRRFNLRDSGPAIEAGFGPEYAGVDKKTLNAYGNRLLAIYDEMVRILGARPSQEKVAVLVTGAARNGLHVPASEPSRDSFLLFHGGGSLSGVASACAARGFFEMWNRFSLVPAPGGGAAWLQEGLPWFWCPRVVGRLALMDPALAYEQFSRVYASYLSDPDATTGVLAAKDAPRGLLATKGASVLAAMAEEMSLTGKGGAVDFEWLLGRMAVQFDHFKGKDYTLISVIETLEDGTDVSWDRFFRRYVDAPGLVLAPRFSDTEIFGTGGTVVDGSRRLEGKSSSKNWIYLGVAVLIVFSIPIVFSSYIRRSVKLDIRMPKILPDDDEDD